jgi:hypothetical protein
VAEVIQPHNNAPTATARHTYYSILPLAKEPMDFAKDQGAAAYSPLGNTDATNLMLNSRNGQ